MGSRVITALEVQKRNKERVNVFLDDTYAFSLSLIEAATLHKGQALSEAEIQALQDESAVVKAVDSAARFLANRPRSAREVRRNLERKDVPPPIIEAAIERLSTMGYLDDVAFARYWVDNRNMFNPRGPRALRYELRQKGVAEDVIETVLGDGLDVVEMAYEAASSRVRRLQGSTQQDFRNKIGSYLQRRGFTFGTIQTAISRLIEELEPTDYFRSDEVE